jgi:uncharacterized protein YbjT (DUF2867 family)
LWWFAYFRWKFTCTLSFMPKNNNRLILVTGATGQQGGAVLKHLRERGFPVRALTRDPTHEKARKLVGQGTEVVRGDLEDSASLTRAIDGVYGVYSVQNWHEGGVEAEIRQGKNLTDAAKRSRVSHLVYSSVAGADQKTGIPHFDSKWQIEQHLQSSGVKYTVLRPVFFMENWLGMRNAIEQGGLELPLLPETPLQMIAVDDIGAFAALVFEKPGRWHGETREIAGDELTMTAIAERLSRAGNEVQYGQVPWDQWEQRAGHEQAVMWRWFQDHGYHVDTALVRQDYQQLTGFDRWLSLHWLLKRTA